MSLESLSVTSCDTFQLDGGLENAIFGSLATPVELSGEEACKSGPMTIYKHPWRERKASRPMSVTCSHRRCCRRGRCGCSRLHRKRFPMSYERSSKACLCLIKKDTPVMNGNVTVAVQFQTRRSTTYHRQTRSRTQRLERRATIGGKKMSLVSALCLVEWCTLVPPLALMGTYVARRRQ